ncbi:MAG: extracellular solute-binding protein [Verrucomicrobia bacterium]|nr:extracellular solute-binding protein [Verrucomicrobiota bacterium]MBV9299857.1 extracellular solute-binding protein [Verrucomicrobiota bacterium]
MRKVIPILFLLCTIIVLPFLFRQTEIGKSSAEDELVIVSPHNEAIRYEFTRAFAEYYRKSTGRSVHIDWRLPGGTVEIVRYLNSQFEASFRSYWTMELRLPWDREVLGAFANPSVRGDADRGSRAERARYAFLGSNAGCGIDLLFGGGSFDFVNLANRGLLVDSGVVSRFPELFGGAGDLLIPRSLGGEQYWDAQGRWVGACLAEFGICYNTEVLARLGVSTLPTQWVDLANSRLFNAIALADPTKSGSVAKAFELMIQQQMNERLAELALSERDQSPERREKQAVTEGWERGLRLLIRLAANSRYFSDSAPKVPIDVAYGEAGAGMCIDFYGRFESEAVAEKSGRTRLKYTSVLGGTSIGADSIALLRGAPHPEIARAFIDFVLKPEGQMIWDFRPGTPGGPEHYTLRRLPIRREFYREPLRTYMADLEADPYRDAQAFEYHEAWTAPLFSAIRFLVRVMCIDSREELVSARKAIGSEPIDSPAFQKLLDVSRVRYDFAMQRIRDTMRSADRLKEVRLAEELTTYFRNQYREAERMARGAK